MSNYSNFVQDFPTRAIKIIDHQYEWAKANDREVTLMLSIAATSFIIPFERLKSIDPEHPAADRDKFKEAKKEFDKFINFKFLSSQLCDKGDDWKYIAEIPASEIKRSEVDRWARPEIRQTLPKDKPINFVISLLRNAISHGSLFTYPYISEEERQRTQGNLPKIETLIFLSQIHKSQIVDHCKKCGSPRKDRAFADKYKLLAVSPDNFYRFLKNWINFLKKLKLE